MSRDDAKNAIKIFNDYKTEVNSAVQFDVDMNYAEALNHYLKALDISNQIVNLPQSSYVVAIKHKNCSLQQRIYEIQKMQQQNNPQYPPKSVVDQQNNQNQFDQQPNSKILNQFQQNMNNNYPKYDMQNQCQQRQYETPPKAEIPSQNPQMLYSNQPKYDLQNPTQNQPKQYENPPKTEILNVFQQNNLYDLPKYDMLNQPRQYENPPKTEIPNVFQQVPLYNPPKYDLLNQNQNHQKQYENSLKTEFPNQDQQNPSYNCQKYEKQNQNQNQNQNQPKIYEIPPKTQYPNQVQPKPYINPQKLEVINHNQTQPKQYENPPKTDTQNQNQPKYSYNYQKYEKQNQNQIHPKQYENVPKTQYPNQAQLQPYINPQKLEVLQNQNQPSQYENPPQTEISNQNQQKPSYNYQKYDKQNQNQLKIVENPPKTQYPNQVQPNPYLNSQKSETPHQNQIKIIENPPKMQYPNQVQPNPYLNSQKAEISHQNQLKIVENPSKSDLQSQNSQKHSKKAPKSLDPSRKGLRYPKHRLSRSPSDLRRNPQNSESKRPVLKNPNKEEEVPKNPISEQENETDLLPNKFGVMDVIRSSGSSNSSDIMPPSMIIVHKYGKKRKRSSSPHASPKKSSSSESKIKEEFYSFEFDINEGKNAQIARKPGRPKRSKSTKTTLKSNNNQPPKQSIPTLLSNLVVQLDMFKVEKKIGAGSFGLVFLVTEKSSGTKYALKEMESPIINRLNEQQLIREIEIMNLARHPLVCHLRGFSLFGQSTTEHHPFIVTDFYPNGSLGVVIAGQKKFDATQKLICLYGIANAMAYLHGLDIVHRDLKPDNVLLDQNDYPIVCDFGLSKLMEMPILRQTSAAGSPVYMAPELMKRQDYSNSIDVYAYAYICYELLTETMAFNDVSDVPTLVNLVCNDKKRPPLNGFDESVLPKAFKKLITFSWSDNPEERPSFINILNYYQKGNLRIAGVDEKKFRAFMNSVPKY